MASSEATISISSDEGSTEVDWSNHSKEASTLGFILWMLQGLNVVLGIVANVLVIIAKKWWEKHRCPPQQFFLILQAKLDLIMNLTFKLTLLLHSSWPDWQVWQRGAVIQTGIFWVCSSASQLITFLIARGHAAHIGMELSPEHSTEGSSFVRMLYVCVPIITFVIPTSIFYPLTPIVDPYLGLHLPHDRVAAVIYVRAAAATYGILSVATICAYTRVFVSLQKSQKRPRASGIHNTSPPRIVALYLVVWCICLSILTVPLSILGVVKAQPTSVIHSLAFNMFMWTSSVNGLAHHKGVPLVNAVVEQNLRQQRLI